MSNMKKKPDFIYIVVNFLCLALLIADIEFKNYFAALQASYPAYLYPYLMTNLAGPLIVCLLIVYRQSHHQKAALRTKIIIDSCSAVIFILYNFFLFHYRFLPSFSPESLILLCLFVVPAAYNIYKKLHTRGGLK
jgi:hypothetical protein